VSGVERHRSAANMRTGQKPPIEPAAHRSGGGRARRDNPRAITRLWLAGCESPLHYCPPSGLDDGPTPARRSTARYANAFLLASSMQLTPRALGCTEGGARHPPRSGCSRTGVGSRHPPADAPDTDPVRLGLVEGQSLTGDCPSCLFADADPALRSQWDQHLTGLLSAGRLLHATRFQGGSNWRNEGPPFKQDTGAAQCRGVLVTFFSRFVAVR
jgi:hypothetical protein